MSVRAKYLQVSLLIRHSGEFSDDVITHAIKQAVQEKCPQVIVGASWHSPAFNVPDSKKKGGINKT